jgi:hypothetical protein
MSLRKRGIATFLCIGVGVLAPVITGAAEQADPVNNALVVELLRKIEQRDAAIQDLQRRVAELERQQSSAKAAEPPVASTPAPKGKPPVAAEAVAPAPAIAATQPTPEQPPERAGVSTGDTRAVAPGQFEVDEEAAERALERTLVRTGVLLLPSGVMEVEPSLAYTRSELGVNNLIILEDIPFILEDNIPFIATDDVRRDIFDAEVAFRFGLPFDSQLDIAIPYRRVEESNVTNIPGLYRSMDSRSASGFGDIRLGLAKTLVREERWWPDLVGRVVWDTDTGSTSDAVGVALGDGFNSLGVSLNAVKRQDPLAFVGGLSYRTTFERDDIEPGDQFGLSLGAVLAASPETSMRFVFTQTVVDETEHNGRDVIGSDLVQGILTLGTSTIVGRATLLDVSADIGVTDEAQDYSLRLSLSKRFDL